MPLAMGLAGAAAAEETMATMAARKEAFILIVEILKDCK
jgi:hypothetical protein